MENERKALSFHTPPAKNGYTLFNERIRAKSSTGLTMSELSGLWQKLSEVQRETFGKAAKLEYAKFEKLQKEPITAAIRAKKWLALTKPEVEKNGTKDEVMAHRAAWDTWQQEYTNAKN